MVSNEVESRTWGSELREVEPASALTVVRAERRFCGLRLGSRWRGCERYVHPQVDGRSRLASRSVSVPVAMVIVVSETRTALAARPVLASATEALLGAGGTDVTIIGSGAVVEVSSQRPVLSPQFEPRAEAALSAALRQVAATLPGARSGVLAVEQFRAPWGVPDLVALAPARLEKRLACAAPPLLSQPDCRLVAAAGRGIDAAALVAAARVSPASADRYLRKLVAVGALNARGDRLRRSAGMVTLGRLWAIEAKVEEWQAGLAQAHRYRLWADGAVLVLGRSRVPVEVIAADAGRYRVGVVVDGHWVARPKVALPDDATRLHASEHMLAALIGATHGSQS